MPDVIGLFGAAGSGKSVAAEALEAQGYRRVRFSTPLKNMLRAYYHTFHLSPEDIERRIEGDLKEEPDPLLFGQTPRYAMQTLGTEWGRVHISENIWSDGWKIRAALALQDGAKVVAEDVRFDTEEMVIRELNGSLIQLTGRAKDEVATGGHASEAMETLKPDLRIQNDGTKEMLSEKIAKALDVLQMQKVVTL